MTGFTEAERYDRWRDYLDAETRSYLVNEVLGGDTEAWRSWALCTEIGDALFFADDDAPSRTALVQNGQARKVCARCPAQAECFAASLMTLNGAPAGVWAGLSDGQRQDIRAGRLPAIRAKVEELRESVDDLERRTAA